MINSSTVSDNPESGSTDDGGYATVWIVIAMALVAVAAATAAAVGAATIARHRASAAADAVALTVALHAIEGSTAACGRGAEVGLADRAEISRCIVDGADATIEVEVQLPGVLARFGPAIGRARAGPASQSPAW